MPSLQATGEAGIAARLALMEAAGKRSMTTEGLLQRITIRKMIGIVVAQARNTSRNHRPTTSSSRLDSHTEAQLATHSTRMSGLTRGIKRK